MCKCKTKCNCNITAITKGEKGDPGNSPVLAFSSVKTPTFIAGVYNFQVSVPANGDYLVMLQGNFTSDAVAKSLVTQLYKATVAQSSNDNFEQGNTIIDFSLFTFTHTAKVTALVTTDTIGYKLTTSDIGASLRNASITLIKL